MQDLVVDDLLLPDERNEANVKEIRRVLKRVTSDSLLLIVHSPSDENAEPIRYISWVSDGRVKTRKLERRK